MFSCQVHLNPHHGGGDRPTGDGGSLGPEERASTLGALPADPSASLPEATTYPRVLRLRRATCVWEGEQGAGIQLWRPFIRGLVLPVFTRGTHRQEGEQRGLAGPSPPCCPSIRPGELGRFSVTFSLLVTLGGRAEYTPAVVAVACCGLLLSFFFGSLLHVFATERGMHCPGAECTCNGSSG